VRGGVFVPVRRERGEGLTAQSTAFAGNSVLVRSEDSTHPAPEPRQTPQPFSGTLRESSAQQDFPRSYGRRKHLDQPRTVLVDEELKTPQTR
jgi:hypothetical protein